MVGKPQTRTSTLAVRSAKPSAMAVIEVMGGFPEALFRKPRSLSAENGRFRAPRKGGRRQLGDHHIRRRSRAQPGGRQPNTKPSAASLQAPGPETPEAPSRPQGI